MQVDPGSKLGASALLSECFSPLYPLPQMIQGCGMNYFPCTASLANPSQQMCPSSWGHEQLEKGMVMFNTN